MGLQFRRTCGHAHEFIVTARSLAEQELNFCVLNRNQAHDVDEGAGDEFFVAAFAVEATGADDGDGAIDEDLVGMCDSIRLTVGEIQGERAKPLRGQRSGQVVSPHVHNCSRGRRRGKANPSVAFI